jgi:hypothetical protein
LWFCSRAVVALPQNKKLFLFPGVLSSSSSSSSSSPSLIVAKYTSAAHYGQAWGCNRENDKKEGALGGILARDLYLTGGFVA